MSTEAGGGGGHLVRWLMSKWILSSNAPSFRSYNILEEQCNQCKCVARWPADMILTKRLNRALRRQHTSAGHHWENGSLCACLMRYDADFQQHPMTCSNINCVQKFNDDKYHFSWCLLSQQADVMLRANVCPTDWYRRYTFNPILFWSCVIISRPIITASFFAKSYVTNLMWY